MNNAPLSGTCFFGKEKEKKKIVNPTPPPTAEPADAQQLEALFRNCFVTAFPDRKPPVATPATIKNFGALLIEVERGDWTVEELEDVWSRGFPIWPRFVSDVGVTTNDRMRPDSYCAVQYVSQMHSYLKDHEAALAEEAQMGCLAPNLLRREMIDAHLQTPKIRTLAYRDPVGVSTQLRDLGDTLTERGVHTPAGIRLLFRAACDYGECGARGIKYWTPNYENLGWNVVPLLFQLRELKQEGHVRRWLRECLNSFVKAIAADPAVDSDPEAAVDRHYDFAVSMAASINVGDEGATAMPQYLLSRSDDLPEAVVNWAKTKMNAALP